MIIQKFTAGLFVKTSDIRNSNSVKTSFKADSVKSEDVFVSRDSQMSSKLEEFYDKLKKLDEDREGRVFSQAKKDNIYNDRIAWGIRGMIEEIPDKKERYKAFNDTLASLKQTGPDMLNSALCGLTECVPLLDPESQDQAFDDIYNKVIWEEGTGNNGICGYLGAIINCISEDKREKVAIDISEKINTADSFWAQQAQQKLIYGILSSDNKDLNYKICKGVIGKMDPEKFGNTPFDSVSFCISHTYGLMWNHKDELTKILEKKEADRKSYINPSPTPKKTSLSRFLGK